MRYLTGQILPALRRFRLRGVPALFVGQPTMPTFILAAAAANTALYQWPLFRFAAANLDTASASGVLTIVTLAVLATVVTATIFGLVALLSQRLVKPLLMLAAVGNAIALYFVQAYGVVLDKTMMGNVFNTDLAEATSLFHPKLLAYVIVLGVLPCVVLARVVPRRAPIRRRLAFVGIVLAAGLGWGYANAKTWLWIDENAKRLGGMTMPWSYVGNGPRYLASVAGPRKQKLLPPATFTEHSKAVVMLVIGEAARASNFSLYGYARPTNPVMSANGVTALKARACSTYTTASLACILSHLGSSSSSWEPLPSYLARSGVDVIWRSNNWGEPAMKVQTFERAETLRPTCQGGDCDHDELLLQGLEERIRASTQERVFVVLHLAGSHGPRYDMKYPPRAERFTPVCRSVELSKCSADELVNAYDNSIVYTDEMVGKTIEVLRKLSPMPAMLMFVSDHGESLGEYGLYLHGTPWSIAPDVQKDIPFVVWMSDSLKQHKSIAARELAADARHSHANVFHSVMGAFSMRSEVYRPELDVFSDTGAEP